MHQRPLGDRLIRTLNERTDDGDRLRRWVGAWIGHGRDVVRIPDVLQEINDELAAYHVRLVPSGIEEIDSPILLNLHLPARHVYTDEWPERTDGRPVHVHFSSRGSMPIVARQFVDFVLSVDAGALAKCGREKCGRYLLQT